MADRAQEFTHFDPQVQKFVRAHHQRLKDQDEYYGGKINQLKKEIEEQKKEIKALEAVPQADEITDYDTSEEGIAELKQLIQMEQRKLDEILAKNNKNNHLRTSLRPGKRSWSFMSMRY